jgi:uncharacterized protein
MKRTDTKTEIERLLPKAHQGYFEAQFGLSMAYMSLEQWDEAYFWLSLATVKASGFGRISAHLTPAQIASIIQRVQEWNPAPDPEAVKFLTDLQAKAEGGDAKAQFELGAIYKQGIIKHAKAAGQGDLAPDMTEALKWWRKAAEKGNMAAQSQLGEAFSKGLGVRPDYAEALKWYRMAAAQGDSVAQDNIDLLTAHGYGEPQKE